MEAAANVRQRLTAAGHDGRVDVEGCDNATAVRQADMVFLTLPFDTLESFLVGRESSLAGKVVVDVVNPLLFADGRFTLARVLDGAVGPWVQRLAPEARVVSAFKNAAAAHLLRLARPAAGDILVASDDAEASAAVQSLVRAIPKLRAVDAGPLAGSAFLESLTALELTLNRRYRTRTSIRILGLESDEPLPTPGPCLEAKK